jgi:hypothetical protein
MKKSQYIKQRNLKRATCKNLVWHIIIITIAMIIALCNMQQKVNKAEQKEACYEAVKIANEAKYDYSDGALYFESCADEDNWHNRNLEFLYESDGLRFYK